MYLLSKIVWALSQPGNLMVLALVAAAACLATPWPGLRRLGRCAVAAVAAIAVLITVLPVGAWLAVPLQDRFPRPPTLPEDVAGIVVLGGGIDVEASRATGEAQLGDAGDRVLAAAALAGRFPGARLIYASGAPADSDADYTEAAAAAEALVRLGIPPARIELETLSRNTRQNALRAFELARPKPGETWVLVTSAWHMPRSVGSFRQAGWEVLPYPVDVMVPGGWEVTRFAFADHLADLNQASKEWVGLVAYRLAGWTDSLLPGPRG